MADDGARGVAQIGVLGGSGLYRLLDDTRVVEVDTPYGPPSDPVVVGQVSRRSVAFLPRHGADHRFPPHRIPYRANLWALRSLGVRQVVAPCAVGSLVPSLGPGSLVVCDQLVDRTSGRVSTFYDRGATHVAFAEPYCPDGRAAAVTAARAAGTDLDAGVEGGSGVTQAGVFSVFRDNTERLRSLLLDVVAGLPLDRRCPCGAALDGLRPDPALP